MSNYNLKTHRHTPTVILTGDRLTRSSYIFLHLPLDIDLTVPRFPINYTVWRIVKSRTTKSARYSTSLRLEKPEDVAAGKRADTRTRAVREKPLADTRTLAHARSYTLRGRLGICSTLCASSVHSVVSNPSFIQGPIHFDRRRMHQAARRQARVCTCAKRHREPANQHLHDRLKVTLLKVPQSSWIVEVIFN